MTAPRYKDSFQTAYVYYEGRLEDGTVFDSNIGAEEPMPILVGKHEVIPGFEDAIAQMSVGEKREIVVPPHLAYGHPKDEAVQRTRLSLLKDGHRLKEGMSFKMRSPVSIYPIDGKVRHIHGDFVEIDFNHPLAGKDLYFSIELVRMTPAPAEKGLI
jgi:peptidylprolyl isomerase